TQGASAKGTFTTVSAHTGVEFELKRASYVMGTVGIEPTRPCGHRFLRPARLPVPPRPRIFNYRKIGRIDITSGRDYMGRFRDGQAATGQARGVRPSLSATGTSNLTLACERVVSAIRNHFIVAPRGAVAEHAQPRRRQR